MDNGSTSPSFRVWLCGTFRAERRVGSGYELVRVAEWGGSSYPRLLLKALLCCPGRQARREALLELLWPDADPEQAVQSLNTAVTRLRKMLAPGKGQAPVLITDEDSHVYRLAEQSLLWVDADAALLLLGEAERRGRTSPEALSLLEEAQTFLSKGMILQDEEGHWAAGRRATVEQARARARLWLAEAYERQGMPGQAATTLSQFLEEDPTDEDVLARLILLLHRQGMTQQALRYYQDFTDVAEREGLEPTEGVRLLAERLRSEKQQSVATTSSPSRITATGSLLPVPLVPSTTSEQGLFFSPPASMTIPEGKNQDVHTLLRRQILQQLFGMTGALFFSPTFLHFSGVSSSQTSHDIEEFIFQCEANITACWQLMKGNDIIVVQSVLITWLPVLDSFSTQTSPYQKKLAHLAAQGYILAGLTTVLQQNYAEAEWCCQQAIEYSMLAEDANLRAAALKHLAAKYLSAKYPLKTLYTYQEALPFIDEVSPLLRSRTYLGLALAYAQCRQKQEAFRYLRDAQDTFPDHPEKDVSFVYADCGLSSLHHYGGLISLEFNEPKKAWGIFEEVMTRTSESIVPKRTEIEIVNCQAAAAVAQRDMELACDHVEKGVRGAFDLKSKKRFRDTLAVYKQMRSVWPHERRVNRLAELFHTGESSRGRGE